MNDEKRDELLIEMRTDLKHVKEWTIEHKAEHKEESSKRLKFILPLYATVLGVVARLIFWK